MIDVEIYELIDRVLNSNYRNKELMNAYEKLGIVLKQLSKRELKQIEMTVSYSKQTCIIIHSNKFLQSEETIKRIEVYDEILSLISRAMTVGKQEKGLVEKCDDVGLSL